MPNGRLYITMFLAANLFFSCGAKKEIVKQQDLEPSNLEPVPQKDVTLSLSAESLRTVNEGYPVGPWDALIINVWNHPDLSKTTIVRKDGTIYMPLISEVVVEGLSVQERQRLITEKFSQFLKNPIVDVEIKEYHSRKVYFLGSIQKPGAYSLFEEINILEAISLAGGPTMDGNLAGTFLIRENRVYPLNLFKLVKSADLSQNIILQDKDIIYIPSSKDMKIFVLGEVKNPGIVPFMNEISVLDAISVSGGALHSAKLDNVKIIKGGLSSPSIINVNFEKILKGKQSYEIYTLSPGDIVYIPKTAIASWNQIIEDITPTLQTLIINPLQATLQVLLYSQQLEILRRQ